MRLAPLPNGTRFATRHLDARVELGRAWVRVTALLRGGRHAKAAGSAWRAGTSSLARRADTGELARPIDGTFRIFHAFSVGLRNTHATRDTRHGRARRTRRARRAFESLRAHHPVRAIRIRLPSSIGRRYANRASETRPSHILPPLAPTLPSLRSKLQVGRVRSHCQSRADAESHRNARRAIGARYARRYTPFDSHLNRQDGPYSLCLALGGAVPPATHGMAGQVAQRTQPDSICVNHSVGSPRRVQFGRRQVPRSR